MSQGYSPRRKGEVVGVAVHADEPRPVWVELHDHAHTYEVAWVETDDGPAITDLRVSSGDGTPITQASLRGINTSTLLRAAQRYDTAEHAEAGRERRAAFDAALGDGSVDTSGVESLRFTESLADAMAKHLPSGTPPRTTPRPGRGGRPKLSREFLAQVAAWAHEGRERNAAVYPYVSDRAAAILGHPVALDTVRGWIRRAKDADLLAADDLRKPRNPQPTPEREDR